MPIARTVSRALLLGAAAASILVPSSVAHAQPTAAQIQQQINQSSASMETIVEQYNKVTEQLAASQAAETALGQQLAPLQAKLDAASANVDKLASAAYMGGPGGTASAVLEAGSPQNLLDQLNALDQIGRRQHSQIAAYQQAKARYDAQKRQLDANLAAQSAQQSVLAAQKAKITSGLKALYALRTTLYGSATETASRSTVAAPYVPGAAGIAVRFAYNALGTPYVWASASPSGYDCSGLTMAAWAAAGVRLPHNAAEQWGVVSHLSRGQLQPGDLVFYNSLGHVAIYVGNNQVIQAPRAGEVVKLSSVDMMPPYGYGRPH